MVINFSIILKFNTQNNAQVDGTLIRILG